jgi:putative DNA methylase
MTDHSTDKYGRPKVFLEGNNVPVAEIGIECQRERGASSALPPLNFLHVWWARRPLTVSRAAILGSLLPVDYDRKSFLVLMGIPKGKDPISERERIDEANRIGKKLETGFSYKRSFTYPIRERELAELSQTITPMWNTGDIRLLDSFSGGGSIPFEAARLGFNVICNELNPVASLIEKGTIDYPAEFGPQLAEDINCWGEKITKEIERKLSDCFPKNPGEMIFAYIWVRTITCPRCSLELPLSPNWWLDKKGKLGYEPIVPISGNTCTFEITRQSDEFDPTEGSVTRGVGRCLRCAEVIDGDEIKRQAQNSEMGHQLAAIGYKNVNTKGRYFRTTTDMDLDGVKVAEGFLEKGLPAWRAKGLVPDEVRYIGPADRSANYGVLQWIDCFNPRQLLVHLTTLETILSQPWEEIQNEKRREALRVYMQFAFDTGLNRNSIQTRFEPSRLTVVGTFDRHDFSFKWSYGEFDGAGPLFNWSIFQQWDSYRKIVALQPKKSTTTFLNSDAANISLIEDKSIDVVIIDPPYYDNVMYAELSDFFYVWMKRGLKDVFPNLFTAELTEKDAEAVANVARFKDAGRGKRRSLAEKDYEAKMSGAFRELDRVLREDGVVTIMFTHKKVEAWNTLARSLLDSGFEITATWPIHTESQKSLHQAKKNAAASTILLVCRKRPKDSGTGWWEDLKPILEQRVQEQADIFEKNGIKRLDLSIACFGVALEVISEKWPVKRDDGTVISPDEALDAAREVVSQWFMDSITLGERKAVDPATQFYVLAWYIFQAREFPFDEARKLSYSVGFSIDDLVSKKVLKKKGGNVIIQTPSTRSREQGIKLGKKSYGWDLDYVHAAMLAYEAEGARGLQRFHQNTEAMTSPGYRNAISYLLDVLPRTNEVVEYHLLNSMWESNLQDSIKRKRPAQQDPTTYEQKKLVGSE